ncbi:MAG: YdcH family protein [Desulfuromonadales bacterium]|nr:YdcH family protein [Desulfuromonadales bacterium]NIS42614.1 YdcH family protein [Desulfuromonadales bacterium]
MAIDDRLQALRTRHADLDQQIENEVRRPNPDDSLISQMKREKLRIKDEIFSIEHQHTQH